jgi:hypothetical protein
VTDEERREARRRTLQRASALQVDTKDWHRIKLLRIASMALNISGDEHPNKMPFSGVLTKLDEPSDAAPGGSGGRLIVVSSSAAREALGSLLGMAVDFTPHFDGHDAKNKIGIITSADVVGNEVLIEGFVYAADFPETATLIKQLKDVLGFSFEAQRLTVEDASADVLRITELTFTGAAILLKDKAAYTTTSLAASATTEDLDMDAAELKTILDSALKPLTDRLIKVESDSTAIMAGVQANATVRAQVEPLASALESCASAMEASGVGAEPRGGHAILLRRMASAMRSDAAMGRVPSSYHDGYYASAEPPTAAADSAAAIKTAVDAALKPLQDQLAAANTKITDLTNTGRLSASAEPGRKTVAPQVSALIARAGIELPGDDGKKLAVSEVDQVMAKANLTMTQKIMLKSELGRIGALAA